MTVEVLPQLRILGCVQLQTRACCRSYGWPGVHDCRRARAAAATDGGSSAAAATTDGRVRVTADTRVLPQLRMVSTRVLPQLRMASTRVLPQLRLASAHDSRRVHNVVTGAQTRAFDSRRVCCRDYGLSGAYDCRRARATVTTAGLSAIDSRRATVSLLL